MREHSLQSSQTIGIPLTNVVPSAVEQDDLLLVAASKNGDQEAFAQLVQRYQRLVFNLVYRMLQQYDEATEITQETFLAAWQGLPSFRGDARFPTWLYRIAYNCSLTPLEQRKRETARQDAIQTEQLLMHGDHRRSAGREAEPPSRQQMATETVSRLRENDRNV